ncbi:hypothetical protein Vafri_2961 [Volvox africanus]|uniref:Uncharacterized protein n=1 Tax=Volvox africanus TaxID=51714 RepID=A0A8J4AV58_9CHLO|nr:hypothetical protein Vafri_2961 [Volvox africanus]
MTWSFPDEWAPRKAQVAGYARQLIRNSSPVPQPPLWKQQQQQQQDEDEDGSAYCVWAAFTHCYFHGLRKPADGNRASTPPSPGEHSEASRWLHRLVGDRGWQEEGPVHSAAARWVGATLLRLQPLFPDVAAMSAGEWAARSEQQRGVAAALRSVATRGDKNVQGRYVPVYPYRMTGTWSENRFKVRRQGSCEGRGFRRADTERPGRAPQREGLLRGAAKLRSDLQLRTRVPGARGRYGGLHRSLRGASRHLHLGSYLRRCRRGRGGGGGGGDERAEQHVTGRPYGPIRR